MEGGETGTGGGEMLWDMTYLFFTGEGKSERVRTLQGPPPHDNSTDCIDWDTNNNIYARLGYEALR